MVPIQHQTDAVLNNASLWKENIRPKFWVFEIQLSLDEFVGEKFQKNNVWQMRVAKGSGVTSSMKWKRGWRYCAIPRGEIRPKRNV